LFKAGEIAGLVLLSLHNLQFYLELMRKMRQALEGGYFSRLRHEFMNRYKTTKEPL